MSQTSQTPAMDRHQTPTTSTPTENVYLVAVLPYSRNTEWVELGAPSSLDLDLQEANQQLDGVHFKLAQLNGHHDTPFQTVSDAVDALRTANRHPAANCLESILVE